MTVKRTILYYVRLSPQEIDEIERHVLSRDNPEGRFRSFAQAIRETAKLGCKVIEYQSMMSDPKRAKQFARKMQGFIKHDQVMEWAQSLEHSQLEGFLMLLEMEKEQRYKQGSLR